MNRKACFSFLSFAAAVLFSAGVLAQEKTEVTIQVKKDGKVIQDTTYRLNDSDEAEHVMKILGVMLGNEIATDEPSGKMVFISKDGETTRVKEIEGDSLVWVSEGEPGDKDVKVIKVRKDEKSKGEHVIVMKGEDDKTFNIILDEDIDGDDMDVEKEIKVIVTGDEDGEWKVIKSGDDENEDVEVQVKVIKKVEKEEK